MYRCNQYGVFDGVKQVFGRIVNIFGMIIVEPRLAANFNDRQGFVVDDAYRHLASVDELFDHAVAIDTKALNSFGRCGRGVVGDFNPDAAALFQGFDDEL